MYEEVGRLCLPLPQLLQQGAHVLGQRCFDRMEVAVSVLEMEQMSVKGETGEDRPLVFLDLR